TETGSGGWTSGLSFVRRAQVTVSVAHWTSLLKQVSNQVSFWRSTGPNGNAEALYWQCICIASVDA
ncbi:MAG: hypothetical protein LW862_22445, partial [Rubrivivax sp.]|nr:hypothetical protein [Rubrivivax sp.]